MESKNVTYNNFKTHEEYIESLVKEQIRKKRESLKITKDILDLDFQKLKKLET